MIPHTYLDHGITILHTKLHSSENPFGRSIRPKQRPFLTISREACAGATTLGRHLLPLLDREMGEEGRSWMFLEKDLLTYALTNGHLPKHFASFLPEDRLSEIKGLIGEIVGLHPPLWEMEKRVAEAIHQIALLGGVIFSGRAAHLVTQDLPGGFHVRLVASLPTRIKRLQAEQHCDASAAAKILQESDSARRRYVQSHFERDINDPYTYDLVINTDHIAPATAAHLILQGLRERKGVPVG
jgi:Cytidylate kinase-like family